jgi:hypothetical protein
MILDKDELKTEEEDEMIVSSNQSSDILLSFVRKGDKFYIGDKDFSVTAESID